MKAKLFSQRICNKIHAGEQLILKNTVTVTQIGFGETGETPITIQVRKIMRFANRRLYVSDGWVQIAPSELTGDELDAIYKQI